MNRRSRSNPFPSRRFPAPPARARWASRLLVALPLLALCVASGIYFTKLARVLRANLAPVAANELTRQLGHQVKLGAVDFAPGELILKDIAVSNRHTWAGSRNEALAVVPRAVIHYRLHDLLFDSGNAGHAIDDIELDSPVALIERWQDRRGRMRFNFSDVIDTFAKVPKKPHAKPFQGRIVTADATVHFRDFMAPARVHERPAYNTVTNLRATVGFASERYVTVNAAGRGVMPKLADVAVRGDISRQAAGRFRLDAKISDADADYWSSYFVQASKVTAKVYATGGRAALDMTFARLGSKPPPGLPLDLSGVVRVRDVSGVLTDPRVKHVSLRGLKGTATFTTDGVTIDGDVIASDQAVHVTGTVFDFLTPQLAFVAQARRIDALRLARDLPQIKLPPGLGVAPGSGIAKITGTPDNPVVTFQAASPLVTFQGNRVTNVRARGLYANYVTRMSPVTFRVGATGQGALRVTINTSAKTPSVSVGGRIAGVNLAALRLPPGAGRLPPLGGLANVAFLANDRAHPLSIVANVTVAHPRVGPTQLRLALGRVEWAPGRPVTVSRALIEDGNGGVATVSGQIPLGPSAPLNLSVNAAGANLSRLLSPYAQGGTLGGTAYAQARVTGTLSRPLITASAQLYGARYGSLLTDAITGKITGTTDGLKLQNVVVRRYPAEASVSGTVTQLASRNPLLGLDVNLRQGDVQDLIGLANQIAPAVRKSGKPSPLAPGALESLTGTARGTFRVTGRVRSPRVTGRAAIKDATFDAYRLSRLSTDFTFQNDTVSLSNAFAQAADRGRIAGATLRGHGHYGLKSGRLAAAVTGQGFPLDLLDPYTLQYADVEGVAGFSARAEGTLKAPTLDATLALRDLRVNDQALDDGAGGPLRVSGRFAGGVFAKTGGPLALVAHYPLTRVAGGEATTEAAITRYVVNDLALTLPTPEQPERRALTLNAAIPETEPERLEHLENALRASKFAQTPGGRKFLDSLDNLSVSPQGNIWAPSLEVSGPFSAPRVAAQVNASGLTLGDENGIGRAEITLRPTDGIPSSNHLDLKAGGLRVGGVPVNTLTAQADYDGDTVTVQSVDARSEQAYLHAAGRAGLGDGGAIAATLDASNVPLALFNSLSQFDTFLKPTYDTEGRRLTSRSLSGQIGTLTVAASGRTLAPDLAASLSLDRPALEVTTYPGPSAPNVTGTEPTKTRFALDSVRSGALTVRPARAGTDAKILTVSDLAAFRGGKPIVTLSGTLPFAWSRPAGAGLLSGLAADQPLHADLRVGALSDLAALAPTLLDPKRTGGALSASVDVRSGTAGQASVLAQVNVADASVAVPGYDTSLVRINGGLTLDGDTLTVRSLSARSSKGGDLTLSGGGTLRLAPAEGESLGAPDLRLSLKDVRLDETSRQSFLSTTYGSGVRGRVNGEITVTAPADRRGAAAWLSPLIATRPDAPLLVSDAVGTLPGKPAPEVAPGPAPVFDPHFGLVFDLGGGRGKTASVQNALLKAEANGDVHIEGSRSAPQLRAHLTVARGQIILPPATLLKMVRPQEAAANTVDLHYPFFASDAVPPGTPTLQTRADVTAQARVTVSSDTLSANQSTVRGGFGQSGVSSIFSPTPAFGGGTGRYTITAHITGDLNGSDLPNLELTSSPPGLTRQQMLASLIPTGALGTALAGGRGAEKALERQFLLALNQVAVPTLLSPLEQGVAQSLGLTDFSVNYSPNSPVLVTLSKDLAPRLQVTYTRSIGARTAGAVNSVLAPPQYTIKLGYGLLHNLQFSASTDDQRNHTLALEGVFGF